VNEVQLGEQESEETPTDIGLDGQSQTVGLASPHQFGTMLGRTVDQAEK